MSVVTPMRGSPHHIARLIVVAGAVASLALPASLGAWGRPHSGGLGAQTLRGGPGADYLRGAEGPDRVRGNGGADLLTGDTGPDSVAGGNGSDTIVGGAGNDVLTGGAGNDIVSGGFGADGIYGGSGDDALEGANDTDTLVGGTGNDVLRGGSGGDRLDGGPGDDRIFSDTGADNIDGGPGDDTIVVDGSAFAHVHCGSGHDRLYISIAADITADYAGRGVLAEYASDCETVRLTDALKDPNTGITYLAPDPGGERSGSARDDILLGGPGADTLRGGDGNDVLWGQRQPDLPSPAPDRLDAGPGDDTVYGGPAQQTISGGPGDDFLEGGIGDNAITGGPGRDTIRLRGTGLSRIDAGAGNDTIYARGSARATIACGSGRDVAYADPSDRVARDCERVVGRRAAARRTAAQATRLQRLATSADGAYAAAVAATPGLRHWWRLGERPAVGALNYSQIADRVGGATSNQYAVLGVPGAVDDDDTAWENTDLRYGGAIKLGIDPLPFTADFTFEAWYRFDDRAVPRTLFSAQRYGPYSGVVLVREGDDSLRAFVDTTGATAELRTVPLDLSPGSWHHVALAHGADRVTLYLDGAVVAESAVGPIAIDPDAAVEIGPFTGGGYQSWVGGVDEIAIYDRGLDASTIGAHVRAGDDGLPPVAAIDPSLTGVVPLSKVAHLTSDHPGSSFRCAFDGAVAYVACKPDVPLYTLADGPHELRVLATSRAGIAQTAPTAVARFTVDATIPSTLLVLRLSPDGDGRAIASFGSPSARRFECRSRRSPLMGAAEGWIPCSAPLDVPRGAFFDVRAVDDAGNPDYTPASVAVPAAGRGLSATPVLATFAGARAEALIAGEGAELPGLRDYQCRVDRRDWAACASTYRLPLLDPGPHLLQVRQTWLGATAATTPIVWNVGPQGGATEVAGMQAPLVLERDARLLRRAPVLRFALSAPAAVHVAVLRGRRSTAIGLTVSGRTGANVVALPSRKLHALGTGRYTVRLTARAAGGRPVTQQLPLAIVPPLR